MTKTVLLIKLLLCWKTMAKIKRKKKLKRIVLSEFLKSQKGQSYLEFERSFHEHLEKYFGKIGVKK